MRPCHNEKKEEGSKEKVVFDSTGRFSSRFGKRKQTWAYSYTQFKIKSIFKSPKFVFNYYERGRRVWQSFTGNPLSNKKALFLSDSFRAFYHAASVSWFQRIDYYQYCAPSR